MSQPPLPHPTTATPTPTPPLPPKLPRWEELEPDLQNRLVHQLAQLVRQLVAPPAQEGNQHDRPSSPTS